MPVVRMGLAPGRRVLGCVMRAGWTMRRCLLWRVPRGWVMGVTAAVLALLLWRM